MQQAAIGVEQERSHAWGVQQVQDPGRSKDSFSRRLCRMIRNRLRLRLRIRILLLLLRQGSRVLTQDKTRYTRIMKPLGDGCMSFEMHHHSSSTRVESPLFSAYGPAGVFCWKVGTNWVGSQREDQTAAAANDVLVRPASKLIVTVIEAGWRVRSSDALHTTVRAALSRSSVDSIVSYNSC